MNPRLTFAEYLSLRDAEGQSEPGPSGAPFAERSVTAGMFKAVNPARPVSPTNSRLLSPTVGKRFKSQVIGR